MMSEQPGHGAAGPASAPGHGYSAAFTSQPTLTSRSGWRTSDFGRFDWFAESEDFGRPLGSADGNAAATEARQVAASEARPRRRHWLGRWRPRRRGVESSARRSWLRGRRLAIAASLLAVACTLLGGMIGGFVALHDQSDQLNPSYNVGSVPSASTNRPAGSVAGIAARDTPGVVMIKVNGGQGTGSGFLIKGGYIVTDNHVVTLDGLVRGAALQVDFSNGKSAKGILVGRDPFSDIAVIKAVGMSDLPALPLGNSAGVAVGDPVIAIGSPLGLADTVTSGIVSAVDRAVQPGAANGTSPQVFFDAIQTDAPINPGNSGGPLVNARGQVIGVDAAIDTLGNDPITGTQGGSIGLGFAIPINQARRVVRQLIRTGHATHSVMGASLNESFAGNGAQIVAGKHGVLPGGPAAAAGLLPGDVIVKIAGQPVANAYTLLDAIRSLAPGSRVALTYIQHGQTHQTELTLGSAQS
jgi:S1-C subfamily serine protease